MTNSATTHATPLVSNAASVSVARFREEVLTFDCVGEQLFGVLTTPAAGITSNGSAVLVVVGGPQYRAGAHRQFVQLARALAADGHAVLRFDQRGMGDSSGAQRSFEAISDDIGAAFAALLARLPSLRRVALFGLCDGASATLLYLHRHPDARVDGLCLLNPWVRSDTTLARTHLKHYYWHRLTDRAFWRKLAGGGVGAGQLRGFLNSWRLSRGSTTGSASTSGAPGFQQAMANAWRGYQGDVLLLLSGDDLTAQEFAERAKTDPAWRGLLEMPRVRRVALAGADHTLSTVEAQTACEKAVREWLVARTTGTRSLLDGEPRNPKPSKARAE